MCFRCGDSIDSMHDKTVLFTELVKKSIWRSVFQFIQNTILWMYLSNINTKLIFKSVLFFLKFS